MTPPPMSTVPTMRVKNVSPHQITLSAEEVGTGRVLRPGDSCNLPLSPRMQDSIKKGKLRTLLVNGWVAIESLPPRTPQVIRGPCWESLVANGDERSPKFAMHQDGYIGFRCALPCPFPRA